MNDQEFDRLIDGALSTYAAEPDAGLAARVGARVRRPGRRWAAWAACAAAAAAVVVVTSWRSSVPVQREAVRPPVAVAKQEPAKEPVVQPAPAPRRPSLVRPAASRPRLVDVLTPEEKQLVALVAAHPELVEQAFAPLPAPSLAPLSIAPLEIEPLTQPQ